MHRQQLLASQLDMIPAISQVELHVVKEFKATSIEQTAQRQ